MTHALRLTRAQRLDEATKAIQDALTSHGSPAAAAAPVLKLPAPPAARTKATRRAWPLGDVVKTLRQKPAPVRHRHIDHELPQGAEFLTHAYSGPAGRRSYQLYLPSQRSAGPPALLIMLHGCTQDATDFAAGTRMNELAETHGLIVAYPAQSKSANSQGCWNWFRPGDQRHGAGEPAIIAGITRDLIAAHDIDPGRVFVAGLSAGGAMAVIMAAAYPDLYAGIGVHSGLAYQSASDVMSAFAAMRGDCAAPLMQSRTRTIVFHGDADATVHPSNASHIVNAQAGLDALALQTETRNAAGGRSYSKTTARDRTGAAAVEQWVIHGAGHAWSGGSTAGTYTDPQGPDASAEMVRFFLSPGLAGRTMD